MKRRLSYELASLCLAFGGVLEQRVVGTRREGIYQNEDCFSVVGESFILSLVLVSCTSRPLEERGLTMTQFPDRSLMVISGGAAIVFYINCVASISHTTKRRVSPRRCGK